MALHGPLSTTAAMPENDPLSAATLDTRGTSTDTGSEKMDMLDTAPKTGDLSAASQANMENSGTEKAMDTTDARSGRLKRPLSEDGTAHEDNFNRGPPQGVHPDMWDMMRSIKSDTTSLIESVSNVDHRVLVLEDQADHMGAEIAKLRKEYKDIVEYNKIIAGRLFRAEARIKTQQEEITDLRSRSMRDNVIVKTKGPTYKEVKDENTASVFRNFLATEMRVPNTDNIMITRAHRMGVASGDTNRMMIAKVNFDGDQRRIFANAKGLDNDKYSIQKQLPIEVEERRQFAWAEYRRARQQKRPSRFDGCHLIIDGAAVTKYDPVELPPASSLLSGEQPSPVIVGAGDVVCERDHDFQAWLTKTRDLQGVRDAMDLLLKQDSVVGADFIPCAYRLDDGGDGRPIENFESDKDANMGLVLLRALQEKGLNNVAVFVSHKGKHPIASRRRIECAKRALENAMHALSHNPVNLAEKMT